MDQQHPSFPQPPPQHPPIGFARHHPTGNNEMIHPQQQQQREITTAAPLMGTSNNNYDNPYWTAGDVASLSQPGSSDSLYNNNNNEEVDGLPEDSRGDDGDSMGEDPPDGMESPPLHSQILLGSDEFHNNKTNGELHEPAFVQPTLANNDGPDITSPHQEEHSAAEEEEEDGDESGHPLPDGEPDDEGSHGGGSDEEEEEEAVDSHSQLLASQLEEEQEEQDDTLMDRAMERNEAASPTHETHQETDMQVKERPENNSTSAAAPSKVQQPVRRGKGKELRLKKRPPNLKTLLSDSISVRIPLSVTANLAVAIKRSREKRVEAFYKRFPDMETTKEKKGDEAEDDEAVDDEDGDGATEKVEKRDKRPKLAHVPQRSEYASIMDYLEAKYVQGVMIGDDEDVDDDEGQGSVYSETSFLDDSGLQRTVAE